MGIIYLLKENEKNMFLEHVLILFIEFIKIILILKIIYFKSTI